MQPNPSHPAVSQPFIPRSMQFALFVTGFLWLLASLSAAGHAAQGIATRINLSILEAPLEQVFFLFLLLIGFATLSWVATRFGGIRLSNALPSRPTAKREFQLGLAVGWGMLLVAVIPMVLGGTLHPQFWLAPRAWLMAVSSLITLAAGTLALEVAFRGYLFRRMIDAVGPTLATILLSVIYAIFSSFRPNSTSFSVLVTFLTGILFSLAYLRTHGLWLGWGLHFGWDAAMGVVFGLPVGGLVTYSSLVQTTTSGRLWLTGGLYGPESALITALVIIGGMVLLYRHTREYAWAYTHPAIIAAGYPMDVAPPPAHTAMEQAAAAKPAPLVQILATTSTVSSTMPVIEEHLRSNSNITE